MTVVLQRAGIQHRLRLGGVDQGAHRFGQPIEGGATQRDDHAGLGAELTATERKGRDQFLRDVLPAPRQRLRQDHDRVDARHFGEDRDGVRASRRQIEERSTTLQ